MLRLLAADGGSGRTETRDCRRRYAQIEKTRAGQKTRTPETGGEVQMAPAPRIPGEAAWAEGSASLGGTFDPIHLGHLIIAQEALAQCCLDRVLFVPSADPPHKNAADVAPAEARARMAALAPRRTARGLNCARSNWNRTGKSYTVETLRQLRGKLGSATEFYLIIGADNAPDMSTWCDPQGILDLAHVTVHGPPRVSSR